jgi:hypothetical protein
MTSERNPLAQRSADVPDMICMNETSDQHQDQHDPCPDREPLELVSEISKPPRISASVARSCGASCVGPATRPARNPAGLASGVPSGGHGRTYS